MNPLKKIAILFSGLLLTAQLNGCATGTSTLECGAESMYPTILSTLDSFESAAISIKLSNRILLQTPIHENDKWPAELYGVPSGEALIRMGLSLFGATQGITIPTQIDPATGFPRPTSALYIFLTERERMLNRETVREDVRFFAAQPANVIARQLPAYRRKPGVQVIDDNIYRNPLMAYGVVMANRAEMVQLQQEVDMIAHGFKLCDAWVHKSSAGEVKPAACKDPALKPDAMELRLKKASHNTTDTPDSASPGSNYAPLRAYESQDTRNVDSFGNPVTNSAVDTLVEQSRPKPARKKYTSRSKRKKVQKNSRSRRSRKPVQQAAVAQAPVSQPQNSYGNEKIVVVNERDRQTQEKSSELENMKRTYGKLANRVYDASVAGADFTMAAITKIACAIVNGVRAYPNAEREIRGWRGAYNAAMLVPRIRNIINAFGYYKDNLGLQFVAYRTMYQQIRGTYPELKDDSKPQTQETMQRIERAYAVLKELEPKLTLLAAGKDVDFEEHEIRQLNRVAALFPEQHEMEQTLKVAWGIAPQAARISRPPAGKIHQPETTP